MSERFSARKRRQLERNWIPPDIEPLNTAQSQLLKAFARSDCVVATGPAGTGKTYLACSFAGQALFHKKTEHVILARPTVGLDQKTMGFLPGNVQKKMEPWVRPLVEAFKRNLSVKKYEEAINGGKLRIEALEHIRGLTFDDAILILDEAQNTTPREMKAFLTRIGDRASVFVCGDVHQSDIRGENGLAWACEAIDRGLVPSSVRCEFTADDVVRSELCRQWGIAFEEMEKERAGSMPRHILNGSSIGALPTH